MSEDLYYLTLKPNIMPQDINQDNITLARENKTD
jgi:hypothetical protein